MKVPIDKPEPGETNNLFIITLKTVHFSGHHMCVWANLSVAVQACAVLSDTRFIGGVFCVA